MLTLHNIADNEEGWIQVVTSMIKVIPLADPLGPSAITLLMDDCPLPSKESIIKVLLSTFAKKIQLQLLFFFTLRW